MKFAILGDTHWGCRNDLSLFYNHFDRFYTNMFEDLREEGITDIFQLGDLFDRRKYINFRTLNEAKRIFFDKIKRYDMHMYTLIGNHDSHMKETIEINSPSLVLGEYSDCVTIYQNPRTIYIDNASIDMIPWICKDNEQEIMEFIAKSKSDLCFGHFEIATFAMYRGLESYQGLPIDLFAKYEKVFSGHYHTKSEKDNIVYVGTPYEMSWQDYHDPKGYHIFDTYTRRYEFIQNPWTLFIRLDYDDKSEIFDLDSIDLTDCFVKVVVTNKNDPYKFDQYIRTLYNKGCYEVKIIEDMSEFADGEIGEDINIEDTLDVLSKYIDSVDCWSDKEVIKKFMKGLYIEAINQEVTE